VAVQINSANGSFAFKTILAFSQVPSRSIAVNGGITLQEGLPSEPMVFSSQTACKEQ
jgi:hypothetical protein